MIICSYRLPLHLQITTTKVTALVVGAQSYNVNNVTPNLNAFTLIWLFCHISKIQCRWFELPLPRPKIIW